MPDLEELWSVVRDIPLGRVMSYGDVGRALSAPASGHEVGRQMASCPQGIPWWRVVAKDGRLPIGKRDPYLAKEQRELLAEEGIAVVNGLVDMSRFAS